VIISFQFGLLKFKMDVMNIRNWIKDEFAKYYYNDGLKGGTWEDTYWMGVKTLKTPMDMWIYQEIIFEIKPDIIVECGTANGGSALFLANILDLIGTGKVLSIDILKNKNLPRHKRIEYLVGSTVDETIFRLIQEKIIKTDKVLIILDSDHRKSHVLAEMKLYSKLVTKGSYMIVEDGNINGHPVLKSYGEGPFEAIEEFTQKNKKFVIDDSKEKFLLTFNPNGYLKKC
jgi:cephalosporin hydroxylase